MIAKILKQKDILKSDATQKLMAFASLIIMFIYFSLASPNFLHFNNMVTIMLSTSVIGVLALGSTFVIITGGIDLSVGTVMAFAAVIAGLVVTNLHMPIFLGVIAAIAAGALCGLISGFQVAKMKIPAFIATLGMLMVTKGLSLVMSGAKPIYFNETPQFSEIAMGSIMGNIIPGFDIPNSVMIFFATVILSYIILSKTILGRYTFALGSNMEATRLSGVNTHRWIMAIYTLCGAYCGLGGILMASRLNSAQPAIGQGYELEAIAAVVIGGTSLSGGEGSILGTFIGAFIMSILTNGLRILSVKQEWQTVFIGIVVIFAVFTDIIRRRK